MTLDSFSKKHINFLALISWFVLYKINQILIKSERLGDWIWQNIKLELYYIAGACQKSGNCCEYIQLFYKERNISEIKDFNRIFKEKSYKCFIPRCKDGHIDYFRCTNLQHDRLCSDYDNRPVLCQSYPLGNLFSEQPLNYNCGYQFRQKENIPRFIKKHLNHKLTKMDQLC